MKKIMARRTHDFDPIYDQKGKLVWDGKAQDIVCCKGEKDVILFMFKNMTNYLDSGQWTLWVK